MKTTTIFYRTNDATDMRKYIDARYDEFGESIVNISTCTDEKWFYCFLTRKTEENANKPENSNID